MMPKTLQVQGGSQQNEKKNNNNLLLGLGNPDMLGRVFVPLQTEIPVQEHE